MGRPKPTPGSLDDMADLLHRDARGPGWSLLTWLADAAFLTSDLIALRYYPTPQGVRTATYRMAQLAAWGLVARRYLRRHRQVWHLTDQGARLVADHLERRPSEVGTGGTEGRLSEAFVRHRLDVTTVEVAMRIHARQHNGNLVSFIREPVIQTEAGDLRPDAAVIYTEGGRTWHYALEVDRDTERPARFVATKVPRYEALVQADWRLHWDELPTCLVVAMQGGRVRAERLKAEIDALPVTSGSYRLFKLAAAGDLFHLPPSSHGNLPATRTAFEQPVCVVARKPVTERRAVFG